MEKGLFLTNIIQFCSTYYRKEDKNVKWARVTIDLEHWTLLIHTDKTHFFKSFESYLRVTHAEKAFQGWNKIGGTSFLELIQKIDILELFREVSSEEDRKVLQEVHKKVILPEIQNYLEHKSTPNIPDCMWTINDIISILDNEEDVKSLFDVPLHIGSDEISILKFALRNFQKKMIPHKDYCSNFIQFSARNQNSEPLLELYEWTRITIDTKNWTLLIETGLKHFFYDLRYLYDKKGLFSEDECRKKKEHFLYMLINIDSIREITQNISVEKEKIILISIYITVILPELLNYLQSYNRRVASVPRTEWPIDKILNIFECDDFDARNILIGATVFTQGTVNVILQALHDLKEEDDYTKRLPVNETILKILYKSTKEYHTEMYEKYILDAILKNTDAHSDEIEKDVIRLTHVLNAIVLDGYDISSFFLWKSNKMGDFIFVNTYDEEQVFGVKCMNKETNIWYCDEYCVQQQATSIEEAIAKYCWQ